MTASSRVRRSNIAHLLLLGMVFYLSQLFAHGQGVVVPLNGFGHGRLTPQAVPSQPYNSGSRAINAFRNAFQNGVQQLQSESEAEGDDEETDASDPTPSSGAPSAPSSRPVRAAPHKTAPKAPRSVSTNAKAALHPTIATKAEQPKNRVASPTPRGTAHPIVTTPPPMLPSSNSARTVASPRVYSAAERELVQAAVTQTPAPSPTTVDAVSNAGSYGPSKGTQGAIVEMNLGYGSYESLQPSQSSHGVSMNQIYASLQATKLGQWIANQWASLKQQSTDAWNNFFGISNTPPDPSDSVAIMEQNFDNSARLGNIQSSALLLAPNPGGPAGMIGSYGNKLIDGLSTNLALSDSDAPDSPDSGNDQNTQNTTPSPDSIPSPQPSLEPDQTPDPNSGQ